MTVLVKLDENLGLTHARALKDLGYEADRVYDEGLSGETDETVWRHVCAEARFFITLDLDFADVRRFPPGHHPGILLLRPRSRSREAVLEVLLRVLREQSLEGLKGCLTVADDLNTRIRRPPTIRDSG
jgi:predicted nuclease of predicted toxin-antitoxin system